MNKKAPGKYSIPSKVFKYRGPQLVNELTKFFTIRWKQGMSPDSWKNATIVAIYKRKGDRSDCGNSSGISFLNVAGKILACVMLHHLLHHLTDRVLPESQAAFWQQRSTVDTIFVAQQFLEKAREYQKKISIAFIDLRKAFDIVNVTYSGKFLKNLVVHLNF